MARARMLLVEDDAVLARSLGRVLSAQMDLAYAATLGEALEALAGEGRLDAVWSDRHLEGPDDGVDVLLAASRVHPAAMLLLVTGTLEAGGLERLPRGVVLLHKSQTHIATEMVLRRFASGDS